MTHPHNVAVCEINGGVMPQWLIADLRTDHAGELGAVWIYRGVLKYTKNDEIKAFASEHLRTEEVHLAGIEALLPTGKRSRLLPLWKICGFLTGYVASMLGTRGFYATIVAVETFVDQHYEEQISRLSAEPSLIHTQLRLEQFRLDEIRHKCESLERCGDKPHPFVWLWCSLVHLGSRTAVAISRHF